MGHYGQYGVGYGAGHYGAQQGWCAVGHSTDWDAIRCTVGHAVGLAMGHAVGLAMGQVRYGAPPIIFHPPPQRLLWLLYDMGHLERSAVGWPHSAVGLHGAVGLTLWG